MVCIDDLPLNLNNLVEGDSGGTWSGEGVDGNAFGMSGLSSGSYELMYVVDDPISICPNDTSFVTITLDECNACPDGNPGDTCDDNDPCTINDVLQADCSCAGTFQDADDDGVCDEDDVCPNFDDNLNGTACDDGNACTINDTYVDCECVGTFQDTDGDGVCDEDDMCPGFDDNLNGTACDDGNACTINDTYVDCECVGTFQDTDGDGVCDEDDMCPGGPEPGTACDDGDPCTIDDIILTDCSCAGTYQDSDGDGVCDNDDVCPDFDDALIGTPCDDGNICTIDDVYTADCVCAGTFEDTDGDGICDEEDSCPELDNALIGTACDDGNPDTEDDLYTADCMCIGTPICMGELPDLPLGRQGALSAANTEVPQDGTEIYTWYEVGSPTPVATIIGNPYYSPSVLGTYYVVVTHPDYDCFQTLGPRTITELNGCCELDDE